MDFVLKYKGIFFEGDGHVKENMAAAEKKQGFLIRFIKLNFGLFLFGLGAVFTMSADIGYSPWDILSDGLAKVLGITFGLSSILQGIVFVLIVWLGKEAIGLGTLFNMVFIGLYIDIIRGTGIIAPGESYIMRYLFFFIGLVIICFASYEYISSGFGAGPRDSLMVFIARHTPLSVGVSRTLLESTAAIVGFLLGGPLGIGTLLAAFCTGFIMEIVFKILKFKPTDVKHETLLDSLKMLTKKA